jgi:4-nitrophenyl phosphatase
MLDFSTIRTVLFDMDGVVYRGTTRLPGIDDLIRFCDQNGISYAFITNNASKTPLQFERKLARMGLEVPGTRVFSSAMVAGSYLRSHYPRGTTVYVIGMEGLQEAIFGDGYFVYQEKEPHLVVMGVDLEVTYEKFKVAALAIRAGARFIVTNPDKAFPSEEGLCPGAGALAAFLQAATDVEPFFVGKPQPTMFQTALDMLEAKAETSLVIGDRLETDVAGARGAGLWSALVLTGVTTRAILETSPHQPDIVFEGLPELLAEWKRHISC